jgi:hypothetical protein
MYNQNSDLMKQEKFMLPTMIEGDFSAEELAEDADGLQMSFQRVKIPAGGTLQFEMPSDDPDNPDYEKNLVAPTGRLAANMTTIPRRFVLLWMARLASALPEAPVLPA